MTEEGKKKHVTNLKELVDLIKQDRKETSTDKDRYSMRNSPNFNDQLKRNAVSVEMKPTQQAPAERNQSVMHINKLDINLSNAFKENIRQILLYQKNNIRKKRQ